MSADPVQQPQDEDMYKFSTYPFSTDHVFQEGLQTIISSAQRKSPEDLETTIGQAKAFYFARATGCQVTWENYLEWQRSHPPSPPETVATVYEAEATRAALPRFEGNSAPLTFQQIADLINTGQTHLIPNNKAIPEALHPDEPSESIRPARKKPWEQARTDSYEQGVETYDYSPRITTQSGA